MLYVNYSTSWGTSLINSKYKNTNVRFFLSYDEITSAVITLYFCHYVRNVAKNVMTFPENL